MKKAVIGAVLLALLLSGCSKGEGESSDKPKSGSEVSQTQSQTLQTSVSSAAETSASSAADTTTNKSVKPSAGYVKKYFLGKDKSEKKLDPRVLQLSGSGDGKFIRCRYKGNIKKDFKLSQGGSAFLGSQDDKVLAGTPVQVS